MKPFGILLSILTSVYLDQEPIGTGRRNETFYDVVKKFPISLRAEIHRSVKLCQLLNSGSLSMLTVF